MFHTVGKQAYYGLLCVAGAGGKYCPDTTSMLDCQPGHFCKSGSSKMMPCPPLLGCPANTESPTDNWLGFALDGVLFLLLALTWQATQLYNQLMRRLSSRERMKILWNSRTIAPEVCVLAADTAHCAANSSPHAMSDCMTSKQATSSMKITAVANAPGTAATVLEQCCPLLELSRSHVKCCAPLQPISPVGIGPSHMHAPVSCPPRSL